MSWVEDRYYKTSRTLLKAVGVWPFRRTKWMHVRAAIILSFFLSFIFVQFAVFLTHEVTIYLATNVLSFAFDTIFIGFLYCIFYFNADADIMQHMYLDWESLSDNMELSIMESYARLTKMFMHVSSGIAIVIGLVTIMGLAIPITLEIAPLNFTYAKTVHVTSEYFVDQTKYYIPVMTHITIAVCIGAITGFPTAIMLLAIGFHGCALFKVANYRMGIVMDETVLQMSSPERERMIYERIIHAVNFHRTAMGFCQILLNHLEISFGIMAVIGVVSTSITLFRFLNALRYETDDLFFDVFIPAASVCIHFAFLFFANHIGQVVADNNSEIFDTAYNLPWYVASPNTKQLLLLVLQRGNKKFYLSLSSLLDASYEGFTTLTMSSISYFTVLYSI